MVLIRTGPQTEVNYFFSHVIQSRDHVVSLCHTIARRNVKISTFLLILQPTYILGQL